MPFFNVLHNMNRFAVLLAFFLAPLSPVFAQQTSTPPPVAKASEPVVSHADWIASLWNPKKGILIQVLKAEYANRRNPLYKSGKGEAQMTLADYLENTGEVLRKAGSLTVITKETQSVYNPRPTPITPADAARYDKDYNDELTLFGSLTKSQWRAIASPNGLGIDDLEPDQKGLWERLVHNPFSYKRRSEGGEESIRTLSETERHAVRLRVKLVANIAAKSAAEGDVRYSTGKTTYSESSDSLYPVDAKGAFQHRSQRTPDTQNHHLFNEAGQWEWGQLIVAEQPVLRKPSDLRYENLIALVSLIPSGKEYLTVRELLTRVREATGVEIYAHKRVADCAIITAGTSGANARQPAGEVLEAVAYSIQGTVRRLPAGDGDTVPLYVLTRDREPTAIQNGRANAWNRASYRLVAEQGKQSRERIVAQNPLEFVTFDSSDGLKPSKELLKQYVDAVRRDPITTGQNGMSIPRTELPPDEQRFITAQAAFWNDFLSKKATEGGSGSQKYSIVSTDMVRISVEINWSYYLPDEPLLHGNLNDTIIGDYIDWLPREKLPAEKQSVDSKGRTLMLAATNETEASLAVRLAIQTGASALWLDAPPDALKVAVKEAGKLSVWAVYHPLRAEDAPDAPPRDRNLYGDIAPTVVPNDPRTIQRAREQARQIATIPHLAGIVLSGVLPTGYRGLYKQNKNSATWTGESKYQNTNDIDEFTLQWGYTPLHRRTFLRQQGADPSDILTGDSQSLSESRSDDSLFARDRNLTEAWMQWKQDRCTELLLAIRRETETTPLLLEGEVAFTSITLQQKKEAKTEDRVAYFIPWLAETEPPLADLYQGGWREAFPVPEAKTNTYLTISSHQTRTPLSEIIERTKRTDTPKLTVIDLSHRSLTEVEAALSMK